MKLFLSDRKAMNPKRMATVAALLSLRLALETRI